MPVSEDVEAEIYFFTAEEGGRSTSVFTGYRPQFYYNGQDWDASHIYPDVDVVNLGETVRVYLGFSSPKEHLGKIYEGMDFLIREGTRTIGRGIVTKIVELEKSAKNANT